MPGPWDIKFPPPVFPVGPGVPIQDRKPPPRRPHKDEDEDKDDARDEDRARDEGEPRIDDYA